MKLKRILYTLTFVILFLFFIGVIENFKFIFGSNNNSIKDEIKATKREFKNNGDYGENWIVLTTINYPTTSIMNLANIGWKVVVIGDVLTPINWNYPNCTFLSLEKQNQLNYEITKLIPTNNYARKNIGYLYAIQHGAKIIYETDDDNNLIKPIEIYEESTLMNTFYFESELDIVVNVYAYFGHPSIWQRGYPLSEITDYSFNHLIKKELVKPYVQQGIASGDPDVDAIFRMTRKQKDIPLNIKWNNEDSISIPIGIFTPYNTQNTIQLYPTFWGLILPITVSFRVCDIWRGYITQRLLWDIGGTISFVGETVSQERNSHNLYNDFLEEDDLYKKTENLIQFLNKWKSNNPSFFERILELTIELKNQKFLGEKDVELTKSWLKDLNNLGYIEPIIIRNFDSHSSYFLQDSLHDNMNTIQKKSYKLIYDDDFHIFSEGKWLKRIPEKCKGSLKNHKVAFMLRTFSNDIVELLTLLINSMNLLIHPDLYDEFVIILDDTQKDREAVKSLLFYSPPKLKVFFEPMPNNTKLEKQFVKNGQDRSQWSNFYSDKYTNCSIIGLLDTDSIFILPMIPKIIINDNNQIIMTGEQSNRWIEGSKKLLGNDILHINQMTHFPIFYFKHTFSEFRNYVEKINQNQNFDEIFSNLLNQIPKGAYSNFCLLGSYAVTHQYSYYEWHLEKKPEVENVNFPFDIFPRFGQHHRIADGIQNTFTFANYFLPWYCYVLHFNDSQCEIYKNYNVDFNYMKKAKIGVFPIYDHEKKILNPGFLAGFYAPDKILGWDNEKAIEKALKIYMNYFDEFQTCSDYAYHIPFQ